MTNDAYQKIIAAWSGNSQGNGGGKESEPKVAPAPEPNLADKLGVKAIPPAQLQALAMLAVAQQSEAQGFQAGMDAKQAEIDGKKQVAPNVLQSAFQTFMNGTEGMSAEQIPPMFDPANKQEDIFDKGAAAAKRTGSRLLKIATTLIMANLPEEFRPKE